jgi:transcriptional regulator with XRE-family HTH domain
MAFYYSFDYSKLRGKIKEVFGTQDKFAKALGIGRVSLSQRLNNILDFSQEEINKACEILGISKEDISIYFFTLKVQKHEQKIS